MTTAQINDKIRQIAQRLESANVPVTPETDYLNLSDIAEHLRLLADLNTCET